MVHISAHLPGARSIIPENESYFGSLAALYEETWNAQDPTVFALRDVVRDSPEHRVDVEVEDQVCVLQWYVNGEVPAYLHRPFQCRNLVVRNEYRELLEWIWSYFSEREGPKSGYKPDPKIKDTSLFPPHNPFEGLNVVSVQHTLNMGAIVTGTPGIGKSLFLLFVLTLRLLAKQTTVFHCVKDEFLIFDETGVYVSNAMNSELRFLPEHTWFLVDSNESVRSPPEMFLIACKSYSRKILVATSPREERFTWLSKNQRVKITWCDIFSFEEMLRTRDSQWESVRMPERLLQSFCNDYGGIARIAFMLADTPLEHEEFVRGKVNTVTWDTLQCTISDLHSGYFETDFSRSIIVVRPGKDKRENFYCEFASEKIAGIVADRYAAESHAKALELYRLFLQNPKARTAAGYLLEATAFTDLQKGGFWRLQEMKKVPGGRNDNVTWMFEPTAESSTLFTGYKEWSITISQGYKSSGHKRRAFYAVNRIDYDPSEEPPPTKSSAMYVPKPSNNPAFDAWFFEPKSREHPIALIQATVQTGSHEIKYKGLDWFKESSLVLIVLSDRLGGQKVFTSLEGAKKIKSVYRMVYT